MGYDRGQPNLAATGKRGMRQRTTALGRNGTAKRAGKQRGLEADIDAVICEIKLEVTHGNLAKVKDRGS